MKKLFLLSLGFLITALLFKITTYETSALKFEKTDPGSDPRCLKFTVKFNADSQWRENGNKRYIMAGCDGEGTITQQRLNPPGCTGGLVKIKPGETAILGRCSCFNIGRVTDQEGCLKIGKELTIEPKINGYKKRRNVTVVKPLTDTSECKVKITNGKGKVLSGNDKGEFICGINEQKKKVNVNINCERQQCPKPDQVTGVKVDCPNCGEAENENTN